MIEDERRTDARENATPETPLGGNHRILRCTSSGAVHSFIGFGAAAAMAIEDVTGENCNTRTEHGADATRSRTRVVTLRYRTEGSGNRENRQGRCHGLERERTMRPAHGTFRCQSSVRGGGTGRRPGLNFTEKLSSRGRGRGATCTIFERIEK